MGRNTDFGKVIFAFRDIGFKRGVSWEGGQEKARDEQGEAMKGPGSRGWK